MRSNEQGRTAQVIACAWVVAVHAGLFWLLGMQQRNAGKPFDGPRMRLVLIERIAPPPPTLPPRSSSRTPSAPRERSTAASPAPAPLQPEAAIPSTASAGELLEQGREWARQQAPAPAFTSDPLRSRRTQLPGGDAPGTFRMRDPVTPARVVEAIGTLFGGGPSSPCPRIGSNIPHLLTATSDRERELLQEELRRDREYCRP